MHLKEEKIMLFKQQSGFTLIEMLVSMVIGLFLLGGVFTIYLSSVRTGQVVDNEVQLMRDAQFALETIAFDLRHAGNYGHANHEGQESVRDEEKHTVATGQCNGNASGWIVNLNRPVFAVEDGTDYISDCMNKWSQGDTLELRYASPLPTNTLESDLDADTLYLKSIPDYSHMFQGDTPPPTRTFQEEDGSTKANIRYFVWNARAYYIANFTDQAGDGVPSLRLLTLEPGPNVNDTILLRGVEDFQVKLGLDTPSAGNESGNESADTYVNPGDVGNRWNMVMSARIWLVLRSEKELEETDLDPSYEVAGVTKTSTDKYRRLVVSTTIRLRNVNTGLK